MLLNNTLILLSIPPSFFISPRTDVMFALIRLHNDIMPLLVTITVFLVYMILWCVYYGVFIKKTGGIDVVTPHATRSNITHNSFLEIVWTITPAVILVFIAIPSFTLLFAMDEITEPTWTLKVVGRQWYWSYEALTTNKSSETTTPSVLLFTPRAWDQYLTFDMSTPNYTRLLSTDKILTIPALTSTRVLVTSADVIHSWAIPAYGVKMDACPGRINQLSLNITRVGLVSGQCSELCGVNHGFMPIAVKAV